MVDFLCSYFHFSRYLDLQTFWSHLGKTITAIYIILVSFSGFDAGYSKNIKCVTLVQYSKKQH
jgi:hypothetical protein